VLAPTLNRMPTQSPKNCHCSPAVPGPSVKPRHIKRLSIRVALRAHRLWVAVTGASLCH
jgi:hypothetical protein